MIYLITSYIKFWLQSTNQHGVHSPFIYNLVTKCFYDTKKHKAYNNIKSYKKHLLNHYKKDTINYRKAKLLYRLTLYFNSKNNLVIGTNTGIITHAIYLGNAKSNITTLTANNKTSSLVRNVFQYFNLKNITLLTNNYETTISNLTKNTYNLVYFNTNLKQEKTLNCFKNLLPTITNNSVFIFNNIHKNKEIAQVWKTIKNHPKVTVTIDTFFLGFVFFRKEQAKQHFTIRL